MYAKLVTFFFPTRIFPVLVAYRWASLLPALLVLRDRSQAPAADLFSPVWTLLIVVLANTIITLFNHLLNRLVIDFPAVMGIDLFFCAAILAMSGGVHSPYYLYALSPLLAGAFFFQVRGAITGSAIFTPLYLLANSLGIEILTSAAAIALVTQLAGLWLIPVLFAYPSTLLKDITRAREELANARDEIAEKHENLQTAHRQLEIIHDLTVLLQAAPDLISVQERVLGAVTADLGFSRAVVALIDPALEELGGWMVYPADSSFPAVKSLSLKSESGAISRSLRNRRAFTTNSEVLVQHAELNNWLNRSTWKAIPLFLREHPVGILLVSVSDGMSRERENILMTVANQAALALGTTILCIDRARRLAVETERNRIARDIHDTVAQSLFGIVYSLDACINMLPSQANEVRNELLELRSLASSAHEEVRRSIFNLWPSPLTIELFMADLTNYVSSCCRPQSFSIVFNNNGDFDSLPAGLRRTIYRMAQEALANSARHSGTASARLCMNVSEDQVYLDISDEGRGFDLSLALSRSLNREHFGLHGIQERARVMGGECEITSRPGGGTRIMISLPTHGPAQDT